MYSPRREYANFDLFTSEPKPIFDNRKISNCKCAVQSAQETEQRRALINAETDAEETSVWFQIYFMNSFHFREG